MDQLLYAELGSDNGSIVLNLSEDGCSFQAIAPVRSQELHFTLAIGRGYEVEGTARVAWLEPTRKVGGLQFTNSSPELRDLIRGLLKNTKTARREQENTKAADALPESEAKLRRRKLREEARLQWEAAQRLRKSQPLETPSPSAQITAPPAPEEDHAPTAEEVQELRPFPMFEERPLHQSGFWQGVAAIVAAAMLASLLAIYHRETGHALAWLGLAIAGDADESKTMPAHDGAKASSPASKSSAVRTASNPGANLLAPNLDPNANTSLPSVVTPTNQSAAGQLMNEKGDLSVAPYSSEDVQTLWAQVESGDTRAEVALADHYARGDGVIKSCGQARVLLEAAIKRGNPDAKRKLDELTQTACP